MSSEVCPSSTSFSVRGPSFPPESLVRALDKKVRTEGELFGFGLGDKKVVMGRWGDIDKGLDFS